MSSFIAIAKFNNFYTKTHIRQDLGDFTPLSLHNRMIEESKKKERKNSCGLLEEINPIDRISRVTNELVDSAQFPLTEEKEMEMREMIEELVQLQGALKNGLDPFERKVRVSSLLESIQSEFDWEPF